MQLIEIDKTRYRKNLNIVIVGFIATLLILSLTFGSILVALFGQTAVVDIAQKVAEQPDNFKYNFLGVFLAVLACAAILHTLKKNAFFHEIYYVWRIKQIQNSIYRKLKAIKAASEEDNINAFIILNFYYNSQKQIYLLDDNTLTLSKLNKDIDSLNDVMANKNLTVTLEQFEKSLLSSFK